MRDLYILSDQNGFDRRLRTPTHLRSIFYYHDSFGGFDYIRKILGDGGTICYANRGIPLKRKRVTQW